MLLWLLLIVPQSFSIGQIPAVFGAWELFSSRKRKVPETACKAVIWGAVSYRGLIPNKSPIFVSVEYEGNPNNINSNMYCDMIKEKVGPAVLEVYPEGNAIFQDDAASIHRTEATLQALSYTFRFRLEHSSQAP